MSELSTAGTSNLDCALNIIELIGIKLVFTQIEKKI